MALSQELLTLLRQWEGCLLSAYPDPASGGVPWTIGYGHTGPEVTAGLTIMGAALDGGGVNRSQMAPVRWADPSPAAGTPSPRESLPG
jgi:hypothetical protein